MIRGICFEMPNEYGTFLAKILNPIDIQSFSWKIGYGESYKVINKELGEDLFSEAKVIDGTTLKMLLENNSYYIIFADLQAFPKGKMEEINTFQDFLKSDCELVLLIVDCCDVTIYCKDRDKLKL